MSARSWIEVAGGLLIVVITLLDVFRSAVLPRPAVGRFLLFIYIFRGVWLAWRWVGTRAAPGPRREAWLAVFAPFQVFFTFGFWSVALIVGYALLLNGLGAGLRPPPESFGESLYYSASTFVPLSYGNILPGDVPTRITAITESASGVILAALVITLLFTLYQSFQAREQLVVALDAMAGAPPSGVQILETAVEKGMRSELRRTFDDWRRWSAAVLESHLAYPILVYFRSSHDNEAWLNSFNAVMDAASLVISSVDDPSKGPAHLTYRVGAHLVEDLSFYFSLGKSSEPYVEREEYNAARARLERVGFTCRGGDEPWKEFARLRAAYAYPLNQMSKRLAIVPAQWIGDRSYLPHRRSRRA